MSSAILFPSPIGGVPSSIDYAPSVLFACLYGVLVLAGLYRMGHPATRTMVSIGTFIFVVERVAAFALRAKQANAPPEDEINYGVIAYWQITIATGYASLGTNALRVLQSLIVNATMGDSQKSNADIEARSDSVSRSTPSSDAQSREGALEKDLPVMRARIRGWFGLITLLGFVTIVLAIAGGTNYVQSQGAVGTANLVRTLRYTANGVAFAVILTLQGLSIWAYSMRRVRAKNAALLMLGIGTLLNVVAIYRIVVSPNNTTSLLSTAPGSLNTTRDKAFFYVFHAAAEFQAAALLLCVDVRRIFGTGPWGDRIRDPKPRV